MDSESAEESTLVLADAALLDAEGSGEVGVIGEWSARAEVESARSTLFDVTGMLGVAARQLWTIGH